MKDQYCDYIRKEGAKKRIQVEAFNGIVMTTEIILRPDVVNIPNFLMHETVAS
jgi:hypothetical protein